MAAQKKKFPAQEIVNGCAEKKIAAQEIIKGCARKKYVFFYIEGMFVQLFKIGMRPPRLYEILY
jgi:hypothetical protein